MLLISSWMCKTITASTCNRHVQLKGKYWCNLQHVVLLLFGFSRFSFLSYFLMNCINEWMIAEACENENSFWILVKLLGCCLGMLKRLARQWIRCVHVWNKVQNLLVFVLDAPWAILLASIEPESIAVTVNGLIPARSYQFRLCAVNDVGKGQFSKETDRWAEARSYIYSYHSTSIL